MNISRRIRVGMLVNAQRDESLHPRQDGSCPSLLGTDAPRCRDDGSQYGLQVVRRTGDGAQHFRDSRLMRSKFGYLLLLL